MVYEYSLDQEAVTAFACCSPREQRRLLAAFAQVALHPFTTGDSILHGENGRENQLWDLGEFVITFWTDHAVRTVRIVTVDRI
jgi:hypothetical protein